MMEFAKIRSLGLLAGLMLGLLIASAHAVYIPASYDNPSRSPGPPHSWGGSHAGLSDLSLTMNRKLEMVVNTYTGNLTLTIPVQRMQQDDRAIPFVIYYNSRSWRVGEARTPLNEGWTHTYNSYAIPCSGKGVWIVEGNGWVHFFARSATGKQYISPKGVFDILQESAGGWVLTRPNHRRLHFDREGRLTHLEDGEDLTWALSYSDNNRLAKITDPSGEQTELTYAGPIGADSAPLLSRITMPNGDYVDLGYDMSEGPSRGPTMITDTSGDSYVFSYRGDRLTSLGEPGGHTVQLAYGRDEAGEPRIIAIGAKNNPALRVTYQYRRHLVSPTLTELWVDIEETRGSSSAASVVRHVYEDTGGSSSMFGSLLRVVTDPGDPPHLNTVRGWHYDSQLQREVAHVE